MTDTVDSIYPPESWLPQAIMDRLGDILLDPHRSDFDSSTLGTAAPPNTLISTTSTPAPRRPLLTMRRIEVIAALEPFFSTVSLAAYESVYRSGGKVDWAAVERGLEADLLEGN